VTGNSPLSQLEQPGGEQLEVQTERVHWTSCLGYRDSALGKVCSQ